ncbi:CU044_5270 family protein [Plantactinospora solaniradicis]|uniref:CU044_5270 family protein n=1 Tax=Plantactinospora solaniradicis TaxID=1723736 RepID=A0ABW1KAD4_9ACTN
MSTRPDVMKLLAEARPGRLDPEPGSRVDPMTITAYPRPSADRRRALPRRRLVVAGALPMAAALTVGALVLTSGGGAAPESTDPGATGPAVAAPADPTSARELLLVAAERTGAEKPDSGRYLVLTRVQGERREVDSANGRYGVAVRARSERWQATRPGDQSVDVVQNIGFVPITPADEAVWRAAGSPTRWTEPAPAGHPDIVHTATAGPRSVQVIPAGRDLVLAGQPVSAAELANLPTDPAALKTSLTARYRRGGGTEDLRQALFFAGRDLVAGLAAPAGVRAAAYRMLADLEGVDFLGRVPDREGRSGMAVAYTRRGDTVWGQIRLIIDPQTGRALAEESWNLGTGRKPAATGTLMGWTLLLHATYSDETPPAGTDRRRSPTG